MIKHYLIVNMMCDCSYLKSQNEIKEFLIDELGDDIERNVNEPDIVMEDTNALMKLARDKMTLKEIIKELEVYQYKVIDLLDLQRDLEDVKKYFIDNDKYVGNICEAIDDINEVNENGR